MTITTSQKLWASSQDFVGAIRELSGHNGNIELDPNWSETALRYMKAMAYLVRGHSEEAQVELRCHLAKVFPTRHRELVTVGPIKAAGVCPHHLLPVAYTVQVGYVPNTYALGLSKLARVAKLLCARAELQEDITGEIADVLMGALDPRGVGVIVTGFHSCMSLRGVEAREATTVTSAMRGIFLDNDKNVRDEFMRLYRPMEVAA